MRVGKLAVDMTVFLFFYHLCFFTIFAFFHHLSPPGPRGPICFPPSHPRKQPSPRLSISKRGMPMGSWAPGPKGGAMSPMGPWPHGTTEVPPNYKSSPQLLGFHQTRTQGGTPRVIKKRSWPKASFKKTRVPPNY